MTVFLAQPSAHGARHQKKADVGVAARRLTFPIVAENMLHMMVGLTDVYLAKPSADGYPRPATAAVGNGQLTSSGSSD